MAEGDGPIDLVKRRKQRELQRTGYTYSDRVGSSSDPLVGQSMDYPDGAERERRLRRRSDAVDIRAQFSNLECSRCGACDSEWTFPDD